MNKEQSESNVQIPPEDSLEFRLLLAYTRKRRPTDSRLQKNSAEQVTSTPEDNTESNKKKNKRYKKRFSWLVRCIKPKTNDTVGPNDIRHLAAPCSNDKKVDDVDDMANKLTEISNSVHFPESDKLESDGINGQDEDCPDAIIQTIVDLLKEHGDRLNEQIIADKALHESLRSLLTYGFFRRVMDAFCKSATPQLPPQQESENTTVALVCEATSKLFSVDHHPMTRVLGFGAKYLQDKFPMWISRNIGNVEDEDEDEDEEEVH